MHTGALMSRRAALLKCEGLFEKSDRYKCEMKPLAKNTGLIEFKDTFEWQQAYKDLKDVLKTREHLPNKQERKEIRKEKFISKKQK